MKVLLIIPTLNYTTVYPSFMSPHIFPTGFAYIAAALERAGHQVIGSNPNNDTRFSSASEMLSDKVRASLAAHAPDLIGIGGLCIDFVFLRDCIEIIRSNAPHTPIVMGGGIVTNDAGYVMQRLKPDFCVIGEGEETIVQLAAVLEENGGDFEKIANLGYWDRGSPRFTRREFDYPDLESRAFPDYEPFGMRDLIDNYSWATILQLRYIRPEPRPMVLVTARGCPFRCTFCVHDKTRGHRTRSVESSMQEIARHYERYRFNVLFIIDETFATNRKRVCEFTAAIMEGKKKHGWDFNWMFSTHASAALDAQTLTAAKQAGLHMFSYGIESASPRVLASMNKSIKPAQILQAIRVSDQVQIGFSGNLIFGDPAEDETTICETMDFFSSHCRDKYLHLFWVAPYPGSRLFDHCLANGIIEDKDAFYEGGCKRPHNMTALPDHVWFPWLLEMDRLGAAYGWHRGVKATEAIREKATNPIAKYYHLFIYSVRATCPCCGHEDSYRELLDWDRLGGLTARTNRIRTYAKRVQGLSRLGFLTELLRIHLFWLTLTPALSRRRAAFKALQALKPGGSLRGQSFLTICKHCHRPFRIFRS